MTARKWAAPGMGLLLAAAGCGRPPAEAALPRAVVAGRIDSTLAALVPRGFAGSVLVIDRGDTLLRKGYGWADRASRRPVTPETGFDIGSLVKPITMAAILKLESQGRLRLGDSLSVFFPRAPAEKAPITVRELLTHSSGLPDLVDAAGRPVRYTPDFDYEPVSREEIVRRAMAATALFSPGARTQYSNLGYSLLGVIVELASGEPFESYVRREILLPAGMSRTGYRAPG